jgi:hypothetical protein
VPACPQCGARVSAYAAGCERCGADLVEAHRRARIAAENAPEPPWWRRISVPLPHLGRGEALYLALTVAAVVWVTVLGLLMAVLGVMHGWYEQRFGVLAAFAVLAAVAAALEVARI